MSCYYVAQIRITDAAAYQKYLECVDQVVATFGGEYVAMDDSPLVLEGGWGPGRFVIIRFPSETEARRWYYSADYQGIVMLRLAAAQCRAVLVKENG